MANHSSPAVLPHVIWSLIGISAFAVGYFAGDRSVPSDSLQLSAPVSLTSQAKAEPSREPNTGEAQTGIASEARTVEQTRANAFEILSIPNRIERTRRFCEFLDSLNAENWRGALEAWNIQTSKEFRLNPAEFDLLIMRVGEVAGAGAVTEALSSDNPRERNQTQALLTAWAASNATAAKQWFEAQPPDLQKQLLKPFLTGLSQTDPQGALRRVISESQDVQDGIVPNIMDSAIQLWGFRRAEQLLTPFLNRADIDDGTRGKVFSKLAHRRISVGQITGDPFEALTWFDNYLEINAPGPIATTQLFANAAARDASATLAWLDERADRLRDFKGDIGYATAAQSLAQQDAAKLRQWLEANPEHPQHDRMIEAAAGTLVRKMSAPEMERLAQSMHDPQMRAKVESVVQRANAGGAARGSGR